MKIHFLGTCAGTEPMPDCRHSSVAIEHEGALYWFDAGEACSFTAHNKGMDLLTVKSVFISHTHMDHIGGLGNLLWNIRKLRYMRQTLPTFNPIRLHIPVARVGEVIMELLRNTEEDFRCDYEMVWDEVKEGVVFKDENVTVTAFRNTHLGVGGPSFSYRFETKDKRVVYSGDVRSYHELDAAIGDGCDALTIETGHFKINDVYEYTKDKNIGKIFFTHNGREILYDRAGCDERVEALFGGRAKIATDGYTVEI